MTSHVRNETIPSGYQVIVEYDDDADTPRNWDNVGTVALVDRCHYEFGDERLNMDELETITNDPNNIVLPVYMYDHSGITINTTGFSCPWDSGQVGIIYCTKEKAVYEWGKKICTAKVRHRAVEYMKGEIETLDDYLTGNVFGFRVLDPEGNDVESCWGFVGDEKYCLEEGLAAAHYIALSNAEGG
jgi:hypothetical protein